MKAIPKFKRYYWLPIFAFYLILRLFSGYVFIELSGDACTYLTLGRNFPFHTLYNHELYLIHPPLYGYLIGFLQLFLPLVQAGLWVSVICLTLAFVALKKLAEHFDLSPGAIALALLYFSLSQGTVVYFSSISRMPVLILGMTLSLIFWLEFLATNQKKFPLKSFVCTSATLLLSEQALALLPVLLIFFWSARRFVKWPLMLRYFIYLIPVACIWPLMRWIVYSTQEIYPAGVDGLVEFVGRADFKSILQPNYLPFTHFFRGYFTAANFAFENIQLRKIFTLPFSLMFFPRIISLGLISLILLPLIPSLLNSRDQANWRTDWALLAATFIFYLPCLFGMHDWYGLPYVIPFSLLVARAWQAFARQYLKFANPDAWLPTGIGFLSILLAAIWLSGPTQIHGMNHYRPAGGRNILFARKPVTPGAEFTAQILKPLPDVGFMSPVGLTPDLVYLSGKRFVALPLDPGLLDSQIRLYQIKYLIFSNENLGRTTNLGWDMANSKVIADHIRRNPQRFTLEKTFSETYPDVYPPATFYLYRVNES